MDNQIGHLKIDYFKVFQNSIKYHSIILKNQLRFNSTQIEEIKLAIRLAKKIVDGGDMDYHGYFKSFSANEFGDQQDIVKIYAVSILPFMLSKFDITKPDIEKREHYKEILHFLQVIKNDKMITNSLAGSTIINKYKNDYPSINFEHFHEFDHSKIKAAIELYEISKSGWNSCLYSKGPIIRRSKDPSHSAFG